MKTHDAIKFSAHGLFLNEVGITIPMDIK